jgi:HSP20 family protein
MSNLVTVPKNGTLTKTNPNANYRSINNLLDEIFNRDLPSIFNSNFNNGISLPKVNIKETADSFSIEMAVPGFKKTEFQIDVDNGILSISTEKNENNEEYEEDYTFREFGFSTFKRTFNLPETVEEEFINANYADGILRISLPKKEEAKRKAKRNIEIS